MNKNIAVISIVILMVGAGAFYGGMRYQQIKIRGTMPLGEVGQGPVNMMGGPGGNRARMMQNGGSGQGFRPVNGEILSIDEKSITVKAADGSSKIVLLSSAAPITKSTVGSTEDLKTGEQVMIFGTENSDGSITAQSIQLNPPGRGSESARLRTP